jgi:DNA uptake protein ComE-like DNA-binding protein
MTHATTLHRAVMAVTATTLIGASGVAGQAGNNMGVLNPNLAGEDEIRALPHMTAELAGTVVAERPFLTMSELHAVLSATLSEEQLSELYRRAFIPVNLNTASREEILLVPGVGPRMAREFDEYRPYRRIEQFRREIGKYVDDEEVAQLEQYVFVPIDLNTASDEDILSIPGVGPRMLREFKEYRPYRSIEQFRREIGKYVSDEEVARMERYVVVGQGGQEGQ